MIKIKQPLVGAIKDYHTILPNGLITQNGVSDEVVGTQLIQRFHSFKVSDIIDFDTFDSQTDPETALLLEGGLVPYCEWLGAEDPNVCFLYILFPTNEKFTPKTNGENPADYTNLVTTVYDYVLPSVLNSIVGQYEDMYEAINQVKLYLTEHGAYGIMDGTGTIYAYLPAFESCSSAQEALDLLDPNSTFTYELETPIIHNLASGGNPYMDFNVVEGGTYEALPTNTPTVETMNADVVFNIDGEDVNGVLGNKTVVTEDEGTWKLKKTFGNTVAWNQLIDAWRLLSQSTSSVTINGVTWTKLSDGSIMANGTASGRSQFDIYVDQPVSGFKGIAHHKYYGYTVNGGSSYTFYGSFINNGGGVGGSTEKFLSTCGSEPKGSGVVLRVNDSITVSNVIFKPMLIDLTLIYGAGNEPSTPEQFEADYERWFGMPLSYEEYDAGSLRSVQLDAIKTVGFNQWDEEWGLGGLDNEGMPTGNTSYFHSKNYISVLQGATYNFHYGSYRDNKVVYFYFYDANKNLITYDRITSENHEIIVPANACYMKFRTGGNDPQNTYNHDICINISDPDKNGTYIPYSTSSLPLTLITLQGTKSDGTHEVMFPDGLKKAGNVYDEIDYSTGKAIKRVGSVDLGSLDYILTQPSSEYYAKCFNATLPIQAKVVERGGLWEEFTTPNGYIPTQGFGPGYVVDKGLNTYNGNGITLQIGDNSYSDAATFKTAMNGIILYYELAEPIEYTIDGFIQEPKRIIANRLPEGYTELEYIKNTNTQYINTGIVPANKKIGAVIDFQFTDTTESVRGVFGSNSQDGVNNIQFTVYQSMYRYKINDWAAYGNTYDTNRHTISLNMSDGTKLDGGVITSTQYTIDSTNTQNCFLGACNYNGRADAYVSACKIYSAKVYDDTTLIRNYVPCRRNFDNVLGMYDTVTGNFLTNQGEGEFIAGPDKNEVKIVYAGQTPIWYNYYGWDYNTSTLTVTRIGNTTWHKELPIQSKMRRCAVKGDGTVKYISSWDYTKYEDGNTVDYTGGDGQIMVEIPEYYYEAYEETVDGVVHKILKLYPYAQIGQKSKKFYCGAFEGITDDASSNTPKLYSISTLTGGTKDGNGNYLAANWTYTSNAADYRGTGGTNDNGIKSNWSRPRTSLSITDFRTRATNRGTGWSQLYFTAYNSILRLYTVEYCNFNSQAAFNSTLTAAGYHQGGLGAGVTNANSSAWNSFNSYNPFIPCGVTKELGSNTGVIGVTYASGEFTSSAYTTHVPSYRGIENPFGHIWKWTDGYTKYGEGSTATVYTCDDITKFSDSVTNQNVPDGYSMKGTHTIGEGNFGDWYWNSDGTFVHKTFGTGPFSDYAYHNNTGTRALCSGGGAYYGARAGLFCWAASNAPSHVSASVGGRLYYTPSEN